MTVTLEQAKAELETLAERAASGEEIRIACVGLPSLRLIAEAPTAEELLQDRRAESPDTQLGRSTGRGNVPKDFDNMFQDEIEKMFYGNPDKFADVEKYLADHPGHALAALDFRGSGEFDSRSEPTDHEPAA